LQTICLGLAILVLPLSFAFFGTVKEDRLDRLRTRLDELSSQLQVQQNRLNELSAATPAERSKVQSADQQR
jgi:Tfp pilus assembly protein PilO